MFDFEYSLDVSEFEEESINKSINKRAIYLVSKRFIDIALCIIASPISIVLIAFFGLLIKIESEGPIFYGQERLGKGGKKFKLYKLRSMIVDAEANGAQWAQKEDPRVTRVGSFIRKTRIDELPQLWNILIGDMTIVGPRPEREVFYELFEERGLPYSLRLEVRPGLTGYAQVNGGYEMKPHEKLEWDIKYMKDRCLFLDIKIITKTAWTVITGHGAR